MTSILSASLLSADPAFLARDIQKVIDAGITSLHIDVMDGHFVPNITMGPSWVEAITRHSQGLFRDVHLMIYSPFNYVERFVSAGADRITFHIEATEEISDTLLYVKRCNKEVGLAINPETPIGLLEPYLNDIDYVLIMGVNPGFGGQSFLPKTIGRIRELQSLLRDHPKIKIGVDGGMDAVNIIKCARLNVDELISGSFLFKSSDMKTCVDLLKEV